MNKFLTLLFFFVCHWFYSQIQIVSPTTIKEKSTFFLCVRIMSNTDASQGNELSLIPLENIDSSSFSKLLNNFNNRIVSSYELPFAYAGFGGNNPIKLFNDSIDSLLSYSSNQQLFFHTPMNDVYICFVHADVEYRLVKNIIRYSYAKFYFSENNSSVEFVKLPKFYEMKILTGFVWKD